jgi:osmotically-inducible protein OsmY
VVKNGRVILLGTVSAKADSDIANIQSNTVPGVFHVFNLLKVKETVDKGKS